MALNRTSDSLSKCDPSLYSNIYDVRKRPDLKQNPVLKTPSIHKDTIEISHDKLKEEALNRLRQTSQIVIAQNSFMRVGKYLFLAVALPPYLLMYGLPKWILVEGLPAVFNLCVMMWNKVHEKTKKHVENGTLKVQKMFQNMQKMSLVLIQPIIRLVLEFRHRIQRLFNQGLQFLSPVKKKFKEALTLSFKKIASNLDRLKTRFSEVKEKLNRKADQVSEKMQEVIQWMKQTPQIILAWGQAQFLRLKEQIASKNSPLTKKLHTSQQLSERAANWVSKQCENGLSAVKQIFEPLTAYFREKLSPRWLSFKKSAGSKWKEARDFFRQKQQKTLAFLEEKQKKLSDLTHHQLIDKLLAQRWLPGIFRRWIQKLLAYSIVQGLVEKCFKGYAFLVRGCLKGSAGLLEGFAKAGKIIEKATVSVRHFGKIMNQMLSKGFEIGYRGFRKFSMLVIYYGILYSLMAGIVTLWGLRSLGSLTTSLTGRFVHLLKRAPLLKVKQ